MSSGKGHGLGKRKGHGEPIIYRWAEGMQRIAKTIMAVHISGRKLSARA